MATQYAFGKIVTDGLVLCLDAADRNSYVSGSTTWFNVAGSNNGTLTNGPTFNTGSGGSIVFDGTNDYIEITPIPSLNNVSQFTYSGFVTFGTKSTWGNAFFSYGQSGVFTNDILIAWDLASSKLFVQVNNGVDGAGSYPYALPSTWFNISVVYNGSLSGNNNRLKMYINSLEVSLTYDYTVPSTTASPSGTLCRLGTYASDVSNVWALNGKIANTLLYNRALSASEVAQNYNAQKSRFGL
jgi:hypothetical protein